MRDWLARGAQPSGTVRKLLHTQGIPRRFTAPSCKELLEHLARGLVEQPRGVRVDRVPRKTTVRSLLELGVAADDYGKVIGRGRPYGAGAAHRGQSRCGERRPARIRRHRRRPHGLAWTAHPERGTLGPPDESGALTDSTAALRAAAPTAQLLAAGRTVIATGEEREIVRRAGTDERPIVRLAEIENRPSAEALRGEELLCPRDAAPELDEDEWWRGPRPVSRDRRRPRDRSSQPPRCAPLVRGTCGRTRRWQGGTRSAGLRCRQARRHRARGDRGRSRLVGTGLELGPAPRSAPESQGAPAHQPAQ